MHNKKSARLTHHSGTGGYVIENAGHRTRGGDGDSRSPWAGHPTEYGPPHREPRKGLARTRRPRHEDGASLARDRDH